MATHNQQWLEERRLGIGGSDVAAVFNEGYGCAAALYDDKTGKQPDYQRPDSEQRILERGTILEDAVADRYVRETGRKVRRMKTKVSKDFPFMRVNIDRQILGDERGLGVLECKTANEWVFKNMKAEGMPEQYVLQIQHAMAVTGYKWGAFAVLEPSSFELLIFDVIRNEKLIAAIIAKEKEFWEHVEAGQRPDALAFGDRRCGSCIYRRSCRGTSQVPFEPEENGRKIDYEDDDSLAELVNDYFTATHEAQFRQNIADEIKNRIKAQIGERQAVSVPSSGVHILYRQQAGSMRWDPKALEGEIDAIAKKDKDLAERLRGCKREAAPTRPFKLIQIV